MSMSRCPEGHMFNEKKHGDICPFCNNSANIASNNDDNSRHKTSNSSQTGNPTAISPITGWIVCTEGLSKGKDYRIMANKNNYLGSTAGMDIQISGDHGSAKRNHAVFVYDPQNRSTLLLPGDARGLVYLNDEVVYTPMELSPYDVVSIEKSKFLFIPLCGEHFEWDEQ